jgi:hypothetical protein
MCLVNLLGVSGKGEQAVLAQRKAKTRRKGAEKDKLLWVDGKNERFVGAITS